MDMASEKNIGLGSYYYCFLKSKNFLKAELARFPRNFLLPKFKGIWNSCCSVYIFGIGMVFYELQSGQTLRSIRSPFVFALLMWKLFCECCCVKGMLCWQPKQHLENIISWTTKRRSTKPRFCIYLNSAAHKKMSKKERLSRSWVLKSFWIWKVSSYPLLSLYLLAWKWQHFSRVGCSSIANSWKCSKLHIASAAPE